MDLSKLSTTDLIALREGRLKDVSTEGLQMLREAVPEQKPLTGTQVATQAIRNLPSSLGQMAQDIYQVVTSPVQTTKAILDVAAGTLQNILPKSVVDAIGPDPASQAAARQVAQFYANRYGGTENLKQTIAKDPAGFLADVSTVLTGGAGLTRATGTTVGKVAPTAGRATTTAADVISKTASYVDPLSATVKATSAGLGTVLPGILGMTTGAGMQPVQEAFKAGKTGGEAAQAFRTNIRGQADMQDVLNAAKANLQTIADVRQADYRKSMAAIKSDKSILDLAGVDDAVTKALERTTFKGQVKDELANTKLQDVKAIVDEWKALDPAEFHTPEGLDALKQRIGAELDKIPFEQKNARAVVGNVYDATKREISKQAPTYDKTMKAYSEASDLIREVEKSLSLGQRASADTALRKLQGIMRNNVNTNYGQRLALMKELEEQGGRALAPALAGQALSSPIPRGIQQATGPLGVLGTFQVAGTPEALALAAASSPRLVGESAYYAGRAAGVPGQVGRGLLDLEARLPEEFRITPTATAIGQQLPPLDFRTLNLLYQLRQREEENQQ